jgi:hypothetical protein
MESMANGRRGDLRKCGAQRAGRIRTAARLDFELHVARMEHMAELVNNRALLRHQQQEQ